MPKTIKSELPLQAVVRLKVLPFSDCSADCSATGLICCLGEGDLPGLESLVPAARGRGRHPGSDGSGAAAPHDPDRDAERSEAIRLVES